MKRAHVAHIIAVAALAAAQGAGCAVTDRRDAASRRPRTDPATSPVCVAAHAACTLPDPFMVRFQADGLSGLDGARVRVGLSQPHRPDPPATATARVEDEHFEACLCVPRPWQGYPVLSAVVYAKGSTGETGADVARAVSRYTYVTAGDEDMSLGLRDKPTRVQVEAALGALDPRMAEVVVRGVDPALDGHIAFAGIVAAERPVAAQVKPNRIEHRDVRFAWKMPGRAWPSEQLAVVLDHNDDQRCDPGDFGALITLENRTEVPAASITWLTGKAIEPVCRALAYDQRNH
ncbi:hypothetical protein A7982_13303 [Minicystis rosea]|nr:hypothetical protein A7982_13303 [Minicystis rosea]